MAWCYEIRGSENRVVEVRSGFINQQEARIAAQRAKRMIECINYPNFEPLTVLTKEDVNVVNHLVEIPAGHGGWLNRDRAGEGAVDLKYPWQRCVVEALAEYHPENLPGRINIAERAISSRLIDPTPCDLDERLALGQSLLALRRLLGKIAAAGEASRSKDKKDIA